MRTLLLGLALCTFGLSAGAQNVRVVDGDTIKMGGTTYRLWGIDAPETKQMCGISAAGVVAIGTLEQLVHGKTITCEFKDRDRYGRTVALCRADGEDLSAAMVKSGAAFAFVRYSHDYVQLEQHAKAENLGVHAFGCDLPWEWRAAHR